MQSDPNRDIATRLRERYELYLVALTFTVLGLSIQSARFGSNLFSDAAELFGWAMLLVAGILGLQRIRVASAIFDGHADMAELERERQQFENLQRRGIPNVKLEDGGAAAPDDLVRDRQETIADAEKKLGSKNKTDGFLYKIQQMLFVAAIALLVIARGYEPFSLVVEGSRIYRCTDMRTKLPVFFEISAGGYVQVSAHHRDGNVYSYSGVVRDYSRFFSDRIYFDAEKDRVGLNMATGSFYIVGADRDPVHSGTCKP